MMPLLDLLIITILTLVGSVRAILASDTTSGHLRHEAFGDSLLVSTDATEGFIYNWLSYNNCDAAANPPYRTIGNPTNVCLVAANGIDSVIYNCTSDTYSKTDFAGPDCSSSAQSGNPTVSSLGCEIDGINAYYWQCSDSTSTVVLPEGSGAWAIINYYDSTDVADECSGDIVEYKGTPVDTCIKLGALSSQFVQFPTVYNYNNADCSGTPSSSEVLDTSCAVASPTDDDSVGITGYIAYVDENTGDELLPTVVPSPKPSVVEPTPTVVPSELPPSSLSPTATFVPTSPGTYPNGYLWRSYSSGDDCGDSIYNVQGGPTNVCLLQTETTSVIYFCSSSGFSVTTYNSADCDPTTQQGLTVSYTYSCQQSYGSYYQSACTKNTDSIPLPSNTGEWMVLKTYNNADCNGDLVYYEGERANICNVVSPTSSQKVTFPNVSTWANTDCYGEPTKGTTFLSTSCASTQVGEDDDVAHGTIPVMASSYIATLQKSPGSSSSSNNADQLSPGAAAAIALGCVLLAVFAFLLLDFFVLGGLVWMRCGMAPHNGGVGTEDMRSPVLG